MSTKESPTRYHLLAFVSPARDVYVTSTASSDFREIYRSHWKGNYPATTPLFYDSRPRLFLLETVEVPKEKTFGRCIQWSRHFHEHGYTVMNWSETLPYVEHPHPDDMGIYRQIRRYNLKKLCRPEHDLATNFTFRETHHTIKLVVTPEEWREFRRDATDKGISIDAYVRERFYNGSVSTLTLSELRQCEQCCRQVATLLDRETKAARLQGAAESEVDRLQAIAEDLRTAAREVTVGIQNYLEVTRL